MLINIVQIKKGNVLGCSLRWKFEISIEVGQATLHMHFLTKFASSSASKL